MENLNIAHLIEKNSITRLTKDYENKLLMKIKKNFNENQQQLFVASFYCFLNYDKKNDFVIDFDNVWKWLGFTRKDNAKRLLEKFFTKNIDYKVQKLAPPIRGASFETQYGGQNKENIVLNINTFKKFCLKADTKKADEVHDYYVKLEELLQETINEESNELKLQLSNKEEEKNKLEEAHKKSIDEIEKLNKQLHKRYEPRIITDEKFVLYLLVAYINGKTIYIIGKTVDITKRYRSYRLKGILMHEEDIKLVYYKSCRSSIILNQVENCVILNMSEYIMEGTREVFETTELNETEMIDNFKHIIDFYVDSFKHVSPHITILNRDKKEETRIRSEMYVEENRDEINEKAREDRVENPEKYQEREKKIDPEKKKAKNKRYNEKHKEEISEYHANYRSIPENREKINNRRRKNVENLTVEQIEEKTKKAKEYREKNKARRKEVSSQKIKCLVCESIFSRQCWKRHTKSTVHCDILKSKPGVKEEYEVVEELVE
jgi:hypothetical protein